MVLDVKRFFIDNEYREVISNNIEARVGVDKCENLVKFLSLNYSQRKEINTYLLKLRQEVKQLQQKLHPKNFTNIEKRENYTSQLKKLKLDIGKVKQKLTKAESGLALALSKLPNVCGFDFDSAKVAMTSFFQKCIEFKKTHKKEEISIPLLEALQTHFSKAIQVERLDAKSSISCLDKVWYIQQDLPLVYIHKERVSNLSIFYGRSTCDDLTMLKKVHFDFDVKVKLNEELEENSCFGVTFYNPQCIIQVDLIGEFYTKKENIRFGQKKKKYLFENERKLFLQQINVKIDSLDVSLLLCNKISALQVEQFFSESTCSLTVEEVLISLLPKSLSSETDFFKLEVVLEHKPSPEHNQLKYLVTSESTLLLQTLPQVQIPLCYSFFKL
eukprot:snap_masked-scaffold_10-processed-gene-11.32-mRNA-1 protein AED:1.00 eAED:1.00 QI:0/0/0/0/1/1/2/0/385